MASTLSYLKLRNSIQLQEEMTTVVSHNVTKLEQEIYTPFLWCPRKTLARQTYE